MSTSPIPRLIDALMAAATTLLPDVHVSDSYSTENPGRLVQLAIGVDDPDRVSQTQSGIADSDWSSTGFRLDLSQSGQLLCHLHAEEGTTDARVVRESVYTAFDTLRELIRSRTHNGVSIDVPGSWKLWVSQERLYQSQYEAGASADLMFTVSFETIRL